MSDTWELGAWTLRQQGFDLEEMGHAESLFALSNGHIGLRGNLDEGEPAGLPGTYLNGFHESRPLPYAESAYGYPESGESVVNITDGKLIRLLVDDEPLDLRYGTVLAHERVLDLRAGLLVRDLDWCSPTGTRVRVRSTRLVSLSQRAVAAVRYEVTVKDGPARVILQSELVANEDMPQLSHDPRVATALAAPLSAEHHDAHGAAALLVHRTKRSELRLAAAMDHVVEAPSETTVRSESHDDWARTTVVCDLAAEQTLVLTKHIAYGWSAQRTLPALRDQVQGALAGALVSGWDGLVAEQREVLDDFWEGADVQIEGDEELQHAVRFALWQVLQAAARAEHRAIPAKGLTGDGYDGHTFWDSETFLLPMLTFVRPDAARDALLWRATTLGLATDRARQLGWQGALFPWRTISGKECSGYWPAGTAAVHIDGDVAAAVLRLARVTGDTEVETGPLLEVLVETARFWLSFGHHAPDGFNIDGVTGPDEYSALADNNTWTNLVAAANLHGAVDWCRRHPAHAERLAVSEVELAAWQRAADAVVLPRNAELGVDEQSEGFTSQGRFDFERTPPESYPLLLHVPYLELYRRQVIKQADLALAMHWFGERFDDAAMASNTAYYEPITVRDSSLSASTQAVVAAAVGHLDLAAAMLAEAAFTDLWDVQRNTRDGLHLAALAGTWLAVVAGFGGLRDDRTDADGCPVLHLAPRLCPGWERLCFRLRWRGRVVGVEVSATEATYCLVGAAEDDGLTLHHHGTEVALCGTAAVTVPVLPAAPLLPRPEQPPGRAPLTRDAARRRGPLGEG